MIDFSSVWGLATVLGPIVLIAVIAYALIRKRRLSPPERAAQKEATERGYRAPEKQH